MIAHFNGNTRREVSNLFAYWQTTLLHDLALNDETRCVKISDFKKKPHQTWSDLKPDFSWCFKKKPLLNSDLL